MEKRYKFGEILEAYRKEHSEGETKDLDSMKDWIVSFTRREDPGGISVIYVSLGPTE